MHRSAAAAVAALALALSPLAFGGGTSDPLSHLQCVAPTDAPGIDRMLIRADSPLAGEGGTFVRAGVTHDIDPRFLVAVAAHETLLETYGPAQEIHNPFGLGPGIVYASERAAITAAGAILARGYLSEGRASISAIAPKWAPVGATNDPGDLNSHWTTGVSRYYRALGGEPDADIRLSVQGGFPPCGPSADDRLGGSLIWVWDGRDPVPSSPGPEGGADSSGTAARLPQFVFPVAAQAGQAVTYLEPRCAAEDDCSVSLSVAQGTPIVAAVPGTLRAASADEQTNGIGFWIETGDDRLGYSPLAEYAPGARDGAAVGAGTVLGTPADELAIRWRRAGVAVNPYPLLDATRPAAL